MCVTLKIPQGIYLLCSKIYIFVISIVSIVVNILSRFPVSGIRGLFYRKTISTMTSTPTCLLSEFFICSRERNKSCRSTDEVRLTYKTLFFMLSSEVYCTILLPNTNGHASINRFSFRGLSKCCSFNTWRITSLNNSVFFFRIK